ncbi:MAG: hypothetical protein KA354_19710 [Phycisphaerae bacterium]|nr:hypothetical protein [Phycisphaerae bacterium]
METKTLSPTEKRRELILELMGAVNSEAKYRYLERQLSRLDSDSSSITEKEVTTNMDETTQTKLNAYLELLAAAKEHVEEEFVAMNLVQEIARDRRAEQIRAERAGRSATQQRPRGDVAGDRASQKQIDWLRDLGVQVPQYCTRARASELLTEALAKQAAR